MIVKTTKQLGNFKRGINLYIPRRSSGTPSNIPLSTTNIVITYNGETRELEKINDTFWYNPIGGKNDSSACEITRFALQYVNSRWEFSTYFNMLDEGNCSTGGFELISTNAGASSSIPVSGWSTSITITTAPSGIVVATANAIVLSGITGTYSDLNGTYIKSGDPTNVTAGGVEGEATGAVFFNSAYTGGNKNGAAIWYGPIPFTSFTGWIISYDNDNRFLAGFIASSRTTEVPISGYRNAVGYTGTITLALSTTTLPLSTPNLYFSGLTLNQDFFDGSLHILNSRFVNPYTRYSNALWRGGRNPYGGDDFNFGGGSNGEWRVSVNCYIDDGYDYFEASITVATAYNQNGSAIPLTGWQYNTDIVLGGSLIISTTP
jgi:hypothetical protein